MSEQTSGPIPLNKVKINLWSSNSRFSPYPQVNRRNLSENKGLIERRKETVEEVDYIECERKPCEVEYKHEEGAERKNSPSELPRPMGKPTPLKDVKLPFDPYYSSTRGTMTPVPILMVIDQHRPTTSALGKTAPSSLPAPSSAPTPLLSLSPEDLALPPRLTDYNTHSMRSANLIAPSHFATISLVRSQSSESSTYDSKYKPHCYDRNSYNCHTPKSVLCDSGSLSYSVSIDSQQPSVSHTRGGPFYLRSVQ
ncbi:hypothetical protein AB6A40_000992 [Gnathostoma spinigerum]|uniref:Uncharacterized protein n=1 Tax=Gnathostoma spinigerum TaxID=75299 RepID=A0ABD6E3B8_9BILA